MISSCDSSFLPLLHGNHTSMVCVTHVDRNYVLLFVQGISTDAGYCTMNVNSDDEWTDIDGESGDESDEDYEPQLDEYISDSDSECSVNSEPSSISSEDEDDNCSLFGNGEAPTSDSAADDDVHPYIKLLKRYGKYLSIISFFYCSPSGVQVVSPSCRWYRPLVAGIALPYWGQLNLSLRQISLTRPLLFEKACHEQDLNPCFPHVGDL